MGGSSFDLIAQEIQKQYYIMEEMKAENRKLHQQLTDLRNGHGIFLEISGTRLALAVNTTPTLSPLPTQLTASFPTATSFPPQDAKKSGEEQIPIADQANSTIATNVREPEMAPATASAYQPMAPATANASQPEIEKTRRPSTFLEEMMFDEFEAALTIPTAIPQVQERTPEISKEEQAAALRRDLIGSFLLE
jgi:hypothetical protein